MKDIGWVEHAGNSDFVWDDDAHSSGPAFQIRSSLRGYSLSAGKT